MLLPAQSVHQEHSRRWVRLSALPAAPGAIPASMHPRRAPCALKARLRQCPGRPRSQYAPYARREPMRWRGRHPALHVGRGAIPTAKQPRRAPCASQARLRQCLGRPRSQYALNARREPMRRKRGRPTVIHAAQGAIPTAVQPHRAPGASQANMYQSPGRPRSRHARPALPAPLRQQEVRAFARRASMQTQYS